MSSQSNPQRIEDIQAITGLRPTHFADLVRVAQLIDNPGGSVSGQIIHVDWRTFGLSPGITENLRALGHQYRHDSPHGDLDLVWDQLTPETRSWFMAHRSTLWHIEEAFPALDED